LLNGCDSFKHCLEQEWFPFTGGELKKNGKKNAFIAILMIEKVLKVRLNPL
jgi:hypothetical protein